MDLTTPWQLLKNYLPLVAGFLRTLDQFHEAAPPLACEFDF